MFLQVLNYDDDIAGLTVGRKNGNITSWQWQVKGKAVRRYGYTYDYLNRLTRAQFDSPNNDYGTTYGYDERGNVTGLSRRGVYNNGSAYRAQSIDELTFNYPSNDNRLNSVTDAAPCPNNKMVNQPLDNTELHAVDTLLMARNTINDGANITFQAGQEITLQPGFHAKAGASFTTKIDVCPQTGYETDGFTQRNNQFYTYDSEGNLTNEPQQGITNIEFNYLNRPYRVTWNNGNTIEWLWDASGKKLQRSQKRGGPPIQQLDYIDGEVEYENDTLTTLYLSGAKATFQSGIFANYQYFIKDHLMSTRVVFQNDGNDEAEIVSEHHSYPFGMAMRGLWAEPMDAKSSSLARESGSLSAMVTKGYKKF